MHRGPAHQGAALLEPESDPRRKPACFWRSVVFRKVEFEGNFVFFNIKTKHTPALFCFLADPESCVSAAAQLLAHLKMRTFIAGLAEFTKENADAALLPDYVLPPRVGQWVRYNQRKHARGELPPYQVAMLNATPGWQWGQ